MATLSLTTEARQLQDLSASHVLRQFMRSYVDQQRKEQQSEPFEVNDNRNSIER